VTELTPPSASTELTALLVQWSRGDRAALERLLPMIYDECRRIASRQLRHEHREHTLDPTALVHEAYLRLVDQRNATWENRAQFFAISAQAMRRILLDNARRHAAAKRGSGGQKISLDDVATLSTDGANESLIALDLALQKLDAIDEEQSRIVELRYFGGLTIEETAEVLKTSPSSVQREWTIARAWLYKAISGSPDPPVDSA